MQRLATFRRDGDRGAVLVWVALLATALFGFAAIAVDIAILYQEHRELQNGADAAALAVALDCAKGTTMADCADGLGTWDATAEYYADDNAEDDTAGAAVDLTQWSSSKVKVKTSTIQAGNAPGHLSLYFANVLGIETGQTTAAATAVWGPPDFGSIGTLPLTFSMCEYLMYVGSGPGLASAPWTEAHNGALQIVKFHTGNQAADPCGAQAGQDADGDGKLPGGFGWVDVPNQTTCHALIVDEIAGGDPGASPDNNDCPASYMRDNVFQRVIFMPVFDDVLTQPKRYHFAEYAAFYVWGYNFGGQYKEPNGFQCPGGNNVRCIAGWFTSGTPSGGTPGSGPDMGVRVVALDE